LAAVVELSINNLSLGADEVVERVAFTANGKHLAGSITADLAGNPHEFEVKEGVSSVEVNTTLANNKVYFTVLPTTLKGGDAYSVVVVTNKQLYMKQGTIPADKLLVFEAGKVTRIGANMAEDVLVGAKWKLVRDASTLKGGDVVTIVAKNYNVVIGDQGLSYPKASQTEAKKVGDYLYHNYTGTAMSANIMQTYTLMQRDAKREAFDFYNGVDYSDDTKVGFAYADGSNNSPKLQPFCDDSTLFDVTITDGVAVVKASGIEGTNKWWRYSHNTYASSRKFDCTTSAPTGNNQICIYKLEGAVGTIPTIAANVATPDSDEKVVIAEEGVAEATAIKGVVFNYVGDWKIAVSDNAEWLNVAYDAAKNCLTYTAEANTGAKREAVVTITASLEGQESLTKTFNMPKRAHHRRSLLLILPRRDKM
jgi:hypothetical protein